LPANPTVQLRLAPSRLAPAAARDALARLGESVEGQTLESTTLLVSELVTNAVRHAGLRGDEWIELWVEALPDRVSVRVTDPGNGISRPPPMPRAERPTGWGLFLVGEIADRWGIERDDHTRVWFEIDRGDGS
jgi:anti-sigma regulatory factor (Ser/Thr protein kinase)